MRKLRYQDLYEEIGLGKFFYIWVQHENLPSNSEVICLFTKDLFWEYRPFSNTETWPNWPVKEFGMFSMKVVDLPIIKDPIKILELYAKFPDKDALAPHIIEDLLK